MAICGNCGAETSRLITHFEGRDGKPMKEPVDACPRCKPVEFIDNRFLNEHRFYANWEANPGEYDTLEFTDTGERVPIIKDWAKGEFEQLIVDGPVAKEEESQAIEAKRAFARERNKTPLTEEQIRQRQDYFKKQFEEVERVMSLERMGFVLPG